MDESIRDPREEIADGYPEMLMRDDYDRRMSSSEIDALAAFIVAASGAEDDEGSGRRGRGRGRGDRSESGGRGGSNSGSG